jgi:hypothetical protein
MSKALDLIKRIEEISYLGQHDDYGNEPNAADGRDAKEYMEPFDDLKLPDGSGTGGDKKRQTKFRPRKSKKENGAGDKVK